MLYMCLVLSVGYRCLSWLARGGLGRKLDDICSRLRYSSLQASWLLDGFRLQAGFVLCPLTFADLGRYDS